MRVSLALVFAAGAALAVAYSAQAQNDDVTPTLHQDIVPPEPGAGRASANMAGKSVFGPQPTEGKNPLAFAKDDKILHRPEGDTKRKGREPILGQGGFAADRQTSARPDRQTGSDGTLHYVSVFNPSVLPFKRMSALDSVDENFQLYTQQQETLHELTVGGAPSDDRDLFWGTMMVDLTPGRDIAIPSVAPDMRILSYEVEPRASLVFSKNVSDNYYVRSEDPDVGGPHRLVFMVDADAGYFAPRVPSRYKVSHVARYAPPEIQVALPTSVKTWADQAVRDLKLNRDMRLQQALDKLTHYFRGFSTKDLPTKSENTYWDLFSNKAGVCRHRSYSFIITALALGIPTRYVTNEAHAWVEVWVPESKWMRVDLGGAALRMEVDNANDKALHRPRAEDPFSSPQAYKDNYTQLEGEINGLTDDQIAERRQTVDTSIAGDTPTFDPKAPVAIDEDAAPRIGPGKRLEELPPSATENKLPAYIHITDTPGEAFRGEGLAITGRLTKGKTPDSEGLDGQRVDIWLSPTNRSGDEADLVGSTVTQRGGAFSAVVSLPDDMQLRAYEVYVTSPGDARYAPALSN